MDNAFGILGLPEDLTVSDETLRAAFRETGRTAHPDAGGGADSFSLTRKALETLSSPARRLAHWMELRSLPLELRGSLDAALMDLFSIVGEVSRNATGVARKRAAAKSALGLALLESETQRAVEALETAIARIDAAIIAETDRFPIHQNAPDPKTLAQAVRNLTFLEKWRASLRGLMPQLV
jgi:curved DNA-binding protein CbpA